MNEQLVLVVSLWLRDGDVAGFEEFERQAARLMARHGGRIERAIRRDAQAGSPDDPFEIHIVTFPTPAAFDAYRADPDTGMLAALRETIIARTAIVAGHDVDSY